jgi:hypothetical protein
VSLWRRLFSPPPPERDERWLSRRLAVALDLRRASGLSASTQLSTYADWTWAVDWVAERLGCTADYHVSPSTPAGCLVLVALCHLCPTDEVNAARVALQDAAPRGVAVRCVRLARRPAAQEAA